MEFCATVAKSLKEVVADPTWVRSTIASRHGMCVVFNIDVCSVHC